MSKRVYSNEDTLDTVDTAQLVDQNSSEQTFDASVDQIQVTASHDVFVAKSSAEADTKASGGLDDRVYIEAGDATVIPWSGSDIYFINANATETPTIYVVGVEF